MSHANNSALLLRAAPGDLGLRLDPNTGMPAALVLRAGAAEREIPLAIAAELIVGGEEQQAQPYGLTYVGTTAVVETRLRTPAVSARHGGFEQTFVVHTTMGAWGVDWEWRFRQQHPRIELSFTISPPPDETVPLRDVRLAIDLALPDLEAWRVEAPGNVIRAGVPASRLLEPVPIATAGSVMGSTGLLAVHHPGQGQTVVIWPFSRTEIGATVVQTVRDTLRCTITTELAGRLAPNTSLCYGAIHFDALPLPWEQVRDQMPHWYGTLGLSTPHDRPGWIEAASIFEVQIGGSVFYGGYRYAPYPTVRDLIDDLERIKGLGFDMLQIMPRQPYPSYNVHDYADITTSYGDEDDLRELVATCHRLGMRVILDILLHGVIDQEVMAQTAARVRSGPYMRRMEESGDTFHGTDSGVRDVYRIAWSRHILDFEPYWSGGSPPRHRLADEHPEWFMRDSQQNIIGIYTKAFDVANVDWQHYFADACEALVRRLDIDGFRFDAPTYNHLPNWSEPTAQRASYSPLGCLQLFDMLRGRLKRLKPDAILYTEPSGVLFRQAMDITYNYDEQWLIGSVMAGNSGSSPTAVRHGCDLAAWFRDRNAVLPQGALITHHIDSHDTFWWPLPGGKWRREQFGIDATRALLAVFALSGGSYMTFVGGEEGLEEDLRRVHRLRATWPALGRGEADYTAVSSDNDAIYAVLRHGDVPALVLVNMSAQPVSAVCTVRLGAEGSQERAFTLHDAWNDAVLTAGGQYTSAAGALDRLQLDFAPYQPRVVLIKPTEP
ncbi:MAG: hypothetical protein RLZZ387_1220 [Chloroflexota bacterium]